jgi:NADH-quinone oxidoreductase subunit G
VTDAPSRAEAEAVWGTAIPSAAGRDIDSMLRATADGSLSALVIGGVDPHDVADPACAAEALARAGFIVSLEVRASAVTRHADVVLPVAPAAEKAGRYVTWEGRRRPFDLTITGTGALTDAQVLDALAEELDVTLGLRTVAAARDEMARFAPATTRAAAPNVHPTDVQTPAAGSAVLATWTELLDAGRAQDGDEHLAGTAKPARAALSAATAAEIGVGAGDLLAVSTDAGALVLPVVIEAMPERVVWLPTNARGCAVRATLGAGSTVQLARSEAPPVIGESS